MLGVLGSWMLNRQARQLPVVQSDLQEYSLAALWAQIVNNRAEMWGVEQIYDAIEAVEVVCAPGTLRQLKYMLPEEDLDATYHPVQNKYNDICYVFYYSATGPRGHR
eukprot:2586473-Rhodomonas_salina.1